MNSPPFERVRGVDPDVLDAAELDQLNADIAACQSWLAALQVRTTRRQRQLAAEGRAADPRSSLTEHGRQSGKEANAASERETVCTSMPAVEAALGSGSISSGHVDAIVGATRNLDEETLSEFHACADELLARADGTSVDAFARSCRDLARGLKNQHRPGSDDEELERQHRESKVSRWVDRETGMHKTLIEMDPVTDRQFWSAVQRQRGLLRQRSTNRQTSWDRLTVDAIVTAVGNGAGQTGSGSGNLVVLIGLDTLVDGDRPGSMCETDSGCPIPVSTARRLACEAGLIPVVLSGDGIVLDQGRAKRLATWDQRIAIAAMHRTCVFPGCEVTVDDCRIHHVREWTREQGETNLEDLAPVCEHHHHTVHEGGWTLTMTADRVATWLRPDGIVHWTGPTVDRLTMAG
jgi:hypothetical protein